MNRSDLERDQRKPVIHTTGLPFSASQHMTTTCETTKEKKKKKKKKKRSGSMTEKQKTAKAAKNDINGSQQWSPLRLKTMPQTA